MGGRLAQNVLIFSSSLMVMVLVILVTLFLSSRRPQQGSVGQSALQSNPFRNVTNLPSGHPSSSREPSSVPSVTSTPSFVASPVPSNGPSTVPSDQPSSQPSVSTLPSAPPSVMSSAGPSRSPSPTTTPGPTPGPTPNPTPGPTLNPTPAPTRDPSSTVAPAAANPDIWDTVTGALDFLTCADDDNGGLLLGRRDDYFNHEDLGWAHNAALDHVDGVIMRRFVEQHLHVDFILEGVRQNEEEMVMATYVEILKEQAMVLCGDNVACQANLDLLSVEAVNYVLQSSHDHPTVAHNEEEASADVFDHGSTVQGRRNSNVKKSKMIARNVLSDEREEDGSSSTDEYGNNDVWHNRKLLEKILPDQHDVGDVALEALERILSHVMGDNLENKYDDADPTEAVHRALDEIRVEYLEDDNNSNGHGRRLHQQDRDLIASALSVAKSSTEYWHRAYRAPAQHYRSLGLFDCIIGGADEFSSSSSSSSDDRRRRKLTTRRGIPQNFLELSPKRTSRQMATELRNHNKNKNDPFSQREWQPTTRHLKKQQTQNSNKRQKDYDYDYDNDYDYDYDYGSSSEDDWHTHDDDDRRRDDDDDDRRTDDDDDRRRDDDWRFDDRRPSGSSDSSPSDSSSSDSSSSGDADTSSSSGSVDDADSSSSSLLTVAVSISWTVAKSLGLVVRADVIGSVLGFILGRGCLPVVGATAFFFSGIYAVCYRDRIVPVLFGD